MGLLSEVEKLNYKQIWVYALVFLGTIASGFLIIFLFKPDLIEKYDVLKLVFLSLALTLPLVEINAVISAILFHNLPNDSENGEAEKNIDAVRGALLLNSIVIYPSLLVCYFCSLKFKWFLGMVGALEFFIFILGMARLLTAKKVTG